MERLRDLGVANENDEDGFHGTRDFGVLIVGVKRPACVAMAITHPTVHAVISPTLIYIGEKQASAVLAFFSVVSLVR
ncbi:hypothetical protein SCA6_014550 [Theobroma cacao]